LIENTIVLITFLLPLGFKTVEAVVVHKVFVIPNRK